LDFIGPTKLTTTTDGEKNPKESASPLGELL